MIQKIKTTLALSIVMAVAVATTGCMTGPGDGQHIGSTTKKIAFNGFMTGPNEKVYLYGLKSYNNWQYLGQVKSGNSAINHFGLDWHLWHMKVQVPGSCWHATGIGNEKLAVIQARDAYGNVLYNFDEGFFLYFDDYDNLGDLWDALGNNFQSIVIYGDG